MAVYNRHFSKVLATYKPHGQGSNEKNLLIFLYRKAVSYSQFSMFWPLMNPLAFVQMGKKLSIFLYKMVVSYSQFSEKF